MSELVNLRTQADLQAPSKVAAKGKNLPEAAAEEARLDRFQATSQQVEKKQEVKNPSEVQAERVEEAVANLNDYIQNTQRKLNFSLDEESGLTVVKVFDAGSGDLIRQIPSEDAVTLAQKLNKDEPLMLFSAQV